MKRNRFVAVVLSLVLLVSLIGGCADNTTADSKSKPTSSTQSKINSNAQANSNNSSQLETPVSTESAITSSNTPSGAGTASSKPANSSKPVTSKPSTSSKLSSSKVPSTTSSSANANFTESENETIYISNILFPKEEYTLEKGSTVTIKPTITPSNATEKLTWESLNTSIATVKNGVVTAVGNGTTTIIAFLESGISASCDVTVYTPVTGISLDQSTCTVYRNKSVSLKATVAPSNASNKRLTWTSSNSAVARVTNGAVYGVSNGTATITVKTEDGSFSKKCTVTVVDPPLSAKYSLYKESFIDGWKEGLTASVSVSGGPINHSNYTFNISIYDQNGRTVASVSKEAEKGASLTVKSEEICGKKLGPNQWEYDFDGTYTAIFKIMNDDNILLSGTATYTCPW